MKTQAVVYTKPNAVEVQEVALPEMEPEDVLIRTECSFVSTGTERWTLQGDMAKRIGGPKFPLVPGYQKAGTVQKTGEAVTGFVPGQRVFMTTGKLAGVTACWGGHVQHSLQNQAEVYALPDSVSSEAASALVIVQVGWNDGNRPSAAPGDLAVVIGDGVIGQFTAQALRARGAEVWLAGHHAMRLERGGKWSADRVLDANREDLLEAVMQARPEGADIVVETVCRPEDTSMYFKMLRVRGQLVIAAYHPESNMVDLSPMQDKEITCYSTGGWTRERMEMTLADLAAGKLHVDPLITHRVPWQEAAGAYERLVRDKTEDSLGIVIDWR